MRVSGLNYSFCLVKIPKTRAWLIFLTPARWTWTQRRINRSKSSSFLSIPFFPRREIKKVGFWGEFPALPKSPIEIPRRIISFISQRDPLIVNRGETWRDGSDRRATKLSNRWKWPKKPFALVRLHCTRHFPREILGWNSTSTYLVLTRTVV